MKTFTVASWTTRIVAYLALAIELIDLFDEFLHINLIRNYHEDVAKLGVLLFLFSLVIWLETSNKSLAKLDRMSAELQRIVQEGEQRDVIGRYGNNATWLAKLLHAKGDDAARFPHCRAGGETLSDVIFSSYAKAAEDFFKLRSSPNDELTLAERSVINLFLYNLVKELPPNSVWLGTSRLQDSRAWRKSSAEPNYHRFEANLESRVKADSLTCLRVLCCDDTERFRQMSSVVQEQSAAGLHVRTFTEHPLPEDITLIWIPKSQRKLAIDVENPVKYLEKNFEPLCGLQFVIRNDTEVKEMNLFGPASYNFENLKIRFTTAWTKGRPFRLDAA